MTDINLQSIVAIAESLGEALGRGVARGIGGGLSGGAVPAKAAVATRRRGRPPKNGAVAAAAGGALCTVEGCGNPARSKGLCSKHYQAARREALGKK